MYVVMVLVCVGLTRTVEVGCDNWWVVGSQYTVLEGNPIYWFKLHHFPKILYLCVIYHIVAWSKAPKSMYYVHLVAMVTIHAHISGVDTYRHSAGNHEAGFFLYGCHGNR